MFSYFHYIHSNLYNFVYLNTHTHTHTYKEIFLNKERLLHKKTRSLKNYYIYIEHTHIHI